MKRRVKWLSLFCLLAMLLALLPGCNALSGITGPSTSLTDQQAAAIVAFAAAPYLDSYLEQAGKSPTNYPVTATGDWGAVYAGERTWKVEGQVLVYYPDGEKTCSTVWTFNEEDGTIKLVEFSCD